MGIRWSEEQLKSWQASRPRRGEDGGPRPIPLQPAGQGAAVTQREAPRAPAPNKTEQRYIDEILLPALQAGEIADWRFEELSFRLGPKCHYRPDFLVVLPDGRIRLDEIKGGWAEEDALVKFRTAVHQFPWFGWRLCRYADRRWSVEVWRE